MPSPLKTPHALRLGCALALLGTAAPLTAGNDSAYEESPINYSVTLPHDAVTLLQRKLARGEIELRGTDLENLHTVLTELGVSPDSQLLVFSRTSFQRLKISPEKPRALYFSESVYVGWIPGGLIEVTAIDPQLGPVFYTLALPDTSRAKATVKRESACLDCHGDVFVRDIPGLFVRSVFADAGGDPLLRHGTKLVDDETPFAERWGGWYVTGYHGEAKHRGNTLASENGDKLVFEPSAARPDEISAFLETSRYLKPTSDVIALLICEHQLGVQNALTHAGFAVRRSIEYQHGLQKAFKEPQTEEPAYDSVRTVIASAVESVLDRLLFRNAATMPGGIIGSDSFRATFASAARRTREGDSLRDLQLSGQLFKYRCSYMIQSESFRNLPAILKNRIFDRLEVALLSRNPADRYAYIPAEEKQCIHAILLETAPEVRARWTRARVKIPKASLGVSNPLRIN